MQPFEVFVTEFHVELKSKYFDKAQNFVIMNIVMVLLQENLQVTLEISNNSTYKKQLFNSKHIPIFIFNFATREIELLSDIHIKITFLTYI